MFSVLSVLNGLFVLLGAFGAHLLQEHFQDFPQSRMWWETATHYAFLHGIALWACVLAIQVKTTKAMPTKGRDAIGSFPKALRLSFGLYTIGLLLFSGSLWTMALTQQRWLGAIVPFGGISWVAFWFSFLGLKLHDRP